MTGRGVLHNRLAIQAGLVLSDGRRWGEIAAPFQWDGARRVLDPDGPPMVWDSRPRGGSKTTDAAGWCIASMLEGLQAGSRLYAFASDKDQGRLVTDALAGLVARTPELAGSMTVDAYKATAPRTGCVLEALPADSASAYGLLPAAVVADEVTQWPVTRNAKELWNAVFSAMPKVPGSKLACITTSGDPAHWTRRIFEQAVVSDRWSVSETPGPLPWVAPEALDEQRQMLTDSAFARLHLNQWCASEDRLTTPEQVRACVGHSGPLDPVAGVSYVAGLDVGLVNDRSVLSMCHVHKRLGGMVVVLDRQWVWQGTKAKPVDLTEIEAVVFEAVRSYRAPLIVDPYQAVHLAQRLRSRGVTVREFTFSSASVGRLALTLYRLLRDAALDLPDDEDLLAELARVRLVESSPGAYRIDHDPSEHDDRVISLALAAQALVAANVSAPATISVTSRLLPHPSPVRPATPVTRPRSRVAGRHEWREGDPGLRRLPGPHRDGLW